MTCRTMGAWTCGFLAGSALGLAAGVLAAPQSGKRTRRMIRRKAEEAEDGIAGAAEEAVDRGREIVDHGKRLVDETVREFSAGVKSAIVR
ncbi:MAG: YtxH domain-containing protein [Acidobacteria bacterium]|nr:YtxH domain-containing protein [Acidobacteriota bacterium]